MRRYKVLVNGENLYLHMEGRRRKLGFYTTVFVSAPDPLRAGQIAIRYMEDDPTMFGSVRNDLDDPPCLSVADVEELGPDCGEPPERTGLAFYNE
jgi:hypothetical protein